MRWKEITESFVTTLVPDYGKRVPFDVFKNPSRKEWREVKGENYDVRGFIVGNDLYVWTVYGDLHANVRTALGIPDPIPVVIEGDPDGQGAGVLVTDMSKHTSWLHNPETAYRIATCSYMRKFGEVEVSYFDESIVGNWQEIGRDEDEDEEEDEYHDDD